jgi:hypothetical protein
MVSMEFVMGYRVHRQDEKYKVVEVNNGEVKDILVGVGHDEAKYVSRTLNFGGGFDGRTPDFFLHKLEVPV